MEDPTPLVQKFFLHLPAPSLRDNTAEVDRLKKQVLAAGGVEHLDVPLAQIPRWVTVLRKSAYRVTATVALSGIVPRLIEVEAGDTRTGLFGLAVDLGTTRIACQLWDLHRRMLIGEIDRENPQVRFGADILTRIQVAEDPEGLKELRECVVEEINRAMADLAGEHSLVTRDIYALTLAGNTTMVHLFLGLDPSTIRREPYIPIINTVDPLSARELGLRLHPQGTVVIFPNVGSYLGGDLISGIRFSRLRDREALSLLVDVGTNAEVVLGNSQWLVGCAGAAGPALEGGVASMGMAAGQGAIAQVRIDPQTKELTYKLIGAGPPVGICGSGLIDLVAEMFLADLIDIQGKFNLNIPSERWTRVEEQPAYLLAAAEETRNGQPLVFSQVDLDILLRSKAAMYTILTTLVQSVGYSLPDIERFYIAGAFGNHIDPERAITIGLLPDLPRERFIPLGNASLKGAAELLLNRGLLEEMKTIAKTITYLEMNVNQDFMNRFSAARFLPHTDTALFPSVQRKR
jgi:uncharacterized 2Fe-2S/4Fe-4S cluster protein (DUF4445 family)